LPELPPSDPEELALQLAEDRREFLAIAPYISMRGPLTLEDTDKSLIIRGFENIDDLKQHRFSRQPLASVGRTLFDELDQYRKSVVPHLETPQFVKDAAVNAAADGELLPLVVVGAAELWSDWMQDVTLRSRQLERDQRCREDYRRLMPLVANLAGNTSPRTDLIKAEATAEGWRCVRVRMFHRAEGSLTNVTLAVNLLSIDGREMMHYYFLPKWEYGEEFTLRPAVDWVDVGGARTIGGRVELFADQLRSQRLPFVLGNNVRTNTDELIRVMRSGLAKKPDEVARRLDKVCDLIRGNESVVPEHNRIGEVLQEARRQVASRIDALRDEITKLQKELDELKKTSKQREKRGWSTQKERIKRVEERIDAAKDEIKSLSSK